MSDYPVSAYTLWREKIRSVVETLYITRSLRTDASNRKTAKADLMYYAQAFQDMLKAEYYRENLTGFWSESGAHIKPRSWLVQKLYDEGLL